MSATEFRQSAVNAANFSWILWALCQAAELNLIPQLPLSGGCPGLTAEVSIYITILSVLSNYKEYLQLIGKYFVDWFCEYA